MARTISSCTQNYTWTRRCTGCWVPSRKWTVSETYSVSSYKMSFR